MAVKKYKATTPGFRGRQVSDYSVLTTDKPYRGLVVGTKKGSGRNNQGKLTVRHKGGGHKRKLRIVDFKRDKDGIKGLVKTIEYDPYRSSYISLIAYADGEKRYILSPQGIKVGDEVMSGSEADIQVGNALPLRNIPDGSIIHNVETTPKKGGQLARSAGSSAVLLAKGDRYANIKLPSGEVHLILIDCKATIGVVGNSDWRNTVVGKAGASRWRGKRPTVRGSVMNPCDHPHGGGEGRAPIGRSGPMTPWGKPTLGYKTRKSKRNKHIVRRRK